MVQYMRVRKYSGVGILKPSTLYHVKPTQQYSMILVSSRKRHRFLCLTSMIAVLINGYEHLDLDITAFIVCTSTCPLYMQMQYQCLCGGDNTYYIQFFVFCSSTCSRCLVIETALNNELRLYLCYLLGKYLSCLKSNKK